MEKRYKQSREEIYRELFLIHVNRKQRRKRTLTQGELNRIGRFIDKQVEDSKYERS